jgi:RNA polymerase sigma factor (sigma-70 family)
MDFTSTRSDAELVADSLNGNRDAFARIVNRYRNLLCSIAFSKAGSITASEDIAQEAFVIAWRHLAELREPGLLRSWLTGIVRRISASHARKEYRRDDLHQVESLDAMLAVDEDGKTGTEEPINPNPGPEHCAESEQEVSLVWQALAALPDKYREPLILFYREEQSMSAMASALGIAEDAARQRLYRGRQLLRREMTQMIEGTLRRTAPTIAFTAAVMAALPTVTPTPAVASSVALAAGAAKGVVEGKGMLAAISGWPWAGPLAGLLTGLASARVAARIYPEGQSRRLVQRHATMIVLGVWMASLLLAAVLATGHDRMSAVNVVALAVVWTGLLLGGILLSVRRMEKALTRLADQQGEAAQPEPDLARWRSTRTCLGLPLVDIAVSASGSGRALGWLAIGDVATSPLLAIGGVGIAPIAIGGITLGVFSLSLFGIALGAIAFGSIAAGIWAFGITAIGWESAVGAAAVALDYALGSLAQANEANTDAASAFISGLWFLPVIAGFAVAAPLLVVLAAVLAMIGWWRVRKSTVASNRGAR